MIFKFITNSGLVYNDPRISNNKYYINDRQRTHFEKIVDKGPKTPL